MSAVALHGAPAAAGGEPPRRHHGVSLVAPLRHGADFKHFDWVNPRAPTGGVVRLHGRGAFDSLNLFAVSGNFIDPDMLPLLHASLLTRSNGEASAQYGLVAEWVSWPSDHGSATFKLRPQARFSDGRPITAADIAFSLVELKRVNPLYRHYFKNVESVAETAPGEITFRFNVTGNRELPHIIGQLPILPKHYWEGIGANGEKRDLAKTTLEPPVTSGPYRVKALEAGSWVSFARIPDWWARDLPAMRGQYNFDEIRYAYFANDVAAFNAFKSGDIDFWHELSASAWATGYDFEGVRKGYVARERLRLDRIARMQGFVFNTRRKHLADRRVRMALDLAFNFERLNKTVMHGAYKRVASYFEGSELKASGLPTGRELEILEAVRDGVPGEVFTHEFRVTEHKHPDDERRHLAEASRLLRNAGWTIDKAGPSMSKPLLRNATGEALSVEFLLYSRGFERVVLPYIAKLELLGIDAKLRTVDPSQYQKRLSDFDFDIVVSGFSQSLSPGNEQRDFWGSAAADRKGSRNLMGIKSPAIDTLIDRIIFASERAELIAATRALDRVLLWSCYLVPQWYDDHDNVATWRMFGRPEQLATRSTTTGTFLRSWWIDEAARKRLKEARGR